LQDPHQSPEPRQGGLRFDRFEVAGAFGDIGTLIPFVVAYAVLAGVAPAGMLIAFGVAMIASGLYYRTPFPVQPMKAIGAAATTQSLHGAALSAGAVHAAALVTGAIWLLLGLTGLTRRVSALMPPSVARGIILGLGLSFMLDGVAMAVERWWLGALALALALALMRNRVLPAMVALLALGAGVAAVTDPAFLAALRDSRLEITLPAWTLTGITWDQLAIGLVFLALPQVPLTLGNAVVAVTEIHNAQFPARKVSETQVSVSTGLMNLAAGAFGGVPMCHGAGGLAGQLRFGARTGGAPVALGVLLVLLGLFLSASVAALLGSFPRPVLGVVLFLAGAEVALGVFYATTRDEASRFVTLAVAAIGTWNVGVAFLVGLLLQWAFRRGWIRI
jgi:predicted benzoate:H+ symporter BenE